MARGTTAAGAPSRRGCSTPATGWSGTRSPGVAAHPALARCSPSSAPEHFDSELAPAGSARISSTAAAGRRRAGAAARRARRARRARGIDEETAKELAAAAARAAPPPRAERRRRSARSELQRQAGRDPHCDPRVRLASPRASLRGGGGGTPAAPARAGTRPSSCASLRPSAAAKRRPHVSFAQRRYSTPATMWLWSWRQQSGKRDLAYAAGLPRASAASAEPARARRRARTKPSADAQRQVEELGGRDAATIEAFRANRPSVRPRRRSASARTGHRHAATRSPHEDSHDCGTLRGSAPWRPRRARRRSCSRIGESPARRRDRAPPAGGRVVCRGGESCPERVATSCPCSSRNVRAESRAARSFAGQPAITS